MMTDPITARMDPERKLTADTWHAAAAAAFKRAGEAVADGYYDRAYDFQIKAERFKRNAYVMEGKQ